MEELCVELAATGQNNTLFIVVAVALFAGAFFAMKARRRSSILPLLGLMMLVGVLFTSSSVFAQSQTNCPPNAPTNPGGEEVAMQLIDDNRTLGLGQPAVLYILQNDIPPEDSSFNQQTIQLLGTAHSFDSELFPILDPGSGADPADDSTWGDDWEHYWGYWRVYENGLVVVYLNDADDFGGTAPSGSVFTIDYLVDTQEGETPSTPATITVTVQDPFVYTAAIFAEDDEISINACESNSDIINLLDNDHASPGTLLPATIDLNPTTPGIQNEYTYYATPSDPIVFSVDGAGMLSLDISGMSNFNAALGAYIVYTVEDTLGNTSNTATIFVSGVGGCG